MTKFLLLRCLELGLLLLRREVSDLSLVVVSTTFGRHHDLGGARTCLLAGGGQLDLKADDGHAATFLSFGLGGIFLPFFRRLIIG